MIAISSSTKRALIAIDINGKRATSELDSNCKHAENILKEIDRLLQEIGEPISGNDCYSVVIGPGSFTGIRIAISLVKGFTACQNDHVITLTTFDLMARSHIKYKKSEKNFFCVINALSGLYYICEYNQYGKKISNESIITKEQLSSLDGEIVTLKEENLGGIQVELTADILLMLSLEKLKHQDFTDKNLLSALYLRKSQAEDNLEKKVAKND